MIFSLTTKLCYLKVLVLLDVNSLVSPLNPLLVHLAQTEIMCLSIYLFANGLKLLPDVIIIGSVKLCTYVYVVVAQTYEFTLHSVDALQRVKV